MNGKEILKEISNVSSPTPVQPIILTAEDAAGKLDEITEKLEQGILDIFNSETYRTYLQTMSRFHAYSLRNTILILLQKPDATYIAGFNAWKNHFGRHVLKGQKGIKVIAPSPYKVKKEVPKQDPITKEILIGADGNPITELREITIPAFKVVSVFDISQTEGKELPSFGVEKLEGSVEQYSQFFSALEIVSPVPVSFETMEDGTHGYFHHAENRIALSDSNGELQTLKTFIHEIAHAKLHRIDPNAKKEDLVNRPDRRTREVQAESVAYTVCQHFGLETSEYSFSYIAGWSSGKDIAELKASLEVIRSTANELITQIEYHLRSQQKEHSLDQEEMTKSFRNEFQSADTEKETLAGAIRPPAARGPLPNRAYLPDTTVSVEDMHHYGYTWDGMLPINEDAAIRYFNANVPVYCLHQDSTEVASWHIEDIRKHANQGGLFGIDKTDWDKYLDEHSISFQDQIQAIFEYEIVSFIPSPERMTQWLPEENSSAINPFFQNPISGSYTMVSEAIIAQKYEEISPSVAQIHTQYENIKKDSELQRAVLANDIDRFSQKYAVTASVLPSPFTIKDDVRRKEAIKMFLLSNPFQLLSSCREIIATIDPIRAHGLDDLIACAKKDYKSLEDNCLSLQRYHKSRFSKRNQVSMADRLNAAKSKAEHHNRQLSQSQRRDDPCLTSTN